MSRFELARRALDDLQDIWEYVSVESLDTADRILRISTASRTSSCCRARLCVRRRVFRSDDGTPACTVVLLQPHLKNQSNLVGGIARRQGVPSYKIPQLFEPTSDMAFRCSALFRPFLPWSGYVWGCAVASHASDTRLGRAVALGRRWPSGGSIC